VNALFSYYDPTNKAVASTDGFPKDAITVVPHISNVIRLFFGGANSSIQALLSVEFQRPRTERMSLYVRVLFTRWFQVGIQPTNTIAEAFQLIRERWDTARYRDGYYKAAIENKAALHYELEKIVKVPPAIPTLDQVRTEEPRITTDERNDTDLELELDDTDQAQAPNQAVEPAPRPRRQINIIG